METAPQILAKWAVLFVTYAAGLAENQAGAEQVAARELDVIAATLAIKNKLGLRDMALFHSALQTALKQAAPSVQLAARKLLQKIDAKPPASAPPAPSQKPRWKKL